MKNQSTTSNRCNPYSTVLFPPSSVTDQVQNIIDSTLEEIQETNEKKSKKNFTYTLSDYISTFLKKPDKKDKTQNQNQSEEPKRQTPKFTKFDDMPTPSQHSVKLLNPINPGSVLKRPASAPPIQRELPTAPDPSHLMETPPERYLLPPFVWGKTAKQQSTSSDYEDVQQAPPPPVHRRRGRPRKNPLPDDYYSSHGNTNILRCHSAQLNMHGSSSATFISSNSGSSTKNQSKKNKNEQSSFLESPQKETSEISNIKTEKNLFSSSVENDFENSMSSNNTTPLRTSSSEASIKIEQPQKFKQRDSISSSDSNNESESDIEPDEVPTISEDRPPKLPEIIFPESDIDEICASRNKNSEYLVKFKGKAYKDAEWIPKDNLMENPDFAPTVLSFEQFGINSQTPYFNPLFQTPQRIIDYNDNLYLIKWTGLGYKYSTWESLDELNVPKANLISLTEKFEELKNQTKNDNELDITYQPININDQFSLDDLQNDVVDRLYNKFCSGSDTNLYGKIGSILRLEIAALLSVLKNRHSLYGPYLLVVASPILKLASSEMSTYTNLTVLTIPDDDDEEFNYIKENAFIFPNETPKFNIVVVSSSNFQRFANEYPQLNYIVSAIDTSEIAEYPLPSIHTIQSMMRITIKKRTAKEEVMDSQDDSTFLHSEFTIFSPMLKSQRALYQQTIADNIDIVTTPPSKIDKSRLYEVVTKLCSLANSPACLNSQEVVFKMANPMMKKKRFEDSGKMRVLKELISYAQTQNKRLMVMCRDPVVLDTLQLYVTAYDIPYVHVGALGLKRMKLDDFSPEAKVNKKIIVLAQFGKQSINWLPLMLDIIVVFDGVYNPMYYFSHAARKPRKRDCLIIRLLAEDSHEAYLGSCADHYEDLPMYDIFKAAAETFMRPARELVIANTKYLRNARYDTIFKSLPNSFQYIFDEEKSAKISSQPSKTDELDYEEKDSQFTQNAQRKKANFKSISSSSSTANFLKIPLSASPSKTAFFPPLPPKNKKNTENQEPSTSSSTQLVKRAEINSSKSSPDISIKSQINNHSSPTTKSILTKLESKTPKSDESDISNDEIEETDDQSPPPPKVISKPPIQPPNTSTSTPTSATNITPINISNANTSNSNATSQAKKAKSVQIESLPSTSSAVTNPPIQSFIKSEKPVFAQQIQTQNLPSHIQNFSNNSGGFGAINSSASAASIDKKFSSIKSVSSEPNLSHIQNSQMKKKRVLKRKIRLEPGQPIPPKPEHGTITIHHHHKRIGSSISSSSSRTGNQIQLHPTSSYTTMAGTKILEASSKGSSAVLSKNPLMSSTELFYKFAELPKSINPETKSPNWIDEDLDLLLILLSNHPWGQWSIFCNIMKNKYSPYSVREASYKIVTLLLNKSESENNHSFGLLRRVVTDHNKIKNENDNDNPAFNECISRNEGKRSIRFRLFKISCMLCVAIVMASSVNPPNDIYVSTPSIKTMPASWWTQIDDKQLIYYVWQNGFSLFACQGRLWSNKTIVHSSLLVQRFEALMKETENSILHKSNIVFPLALKDHFVTIINNEQEETAYKSMVGKVVNDFGFAEMDDICKLSGQIIDQAISNSFALTQCAQVQFIADFFDQIRYELLYPSFYYAEDYQLMESVEFHGRVHSSQSLLIQSMFNAKEYPDYDFNIIINKVKNIFENRKNEPFNHENTLLNSIGNFVPQMPFILSENLKITNLGEISLKGGFHNDKYIYPVGYEAITTFASTFEPNTVDKYICQIVDNGMENPIFKVTSMSKKTVFQDVKPDKVWKQIADKVSYINSMNMFESIKTPGHELFGLSFPTTLRLIQSMKGSDQCMKYRIRAFKVPFENAKH